MTVTVLVGDVRERLRQLPADHFDCAVTSPPYWGLRKYLREGSPLEHYEMGLEATMAEHLAALVDVFRELRRVMKPVSSVWLNYGDCYATTPNGRSAAATKAAGNDDRTFRDKPFSTIGGKLKAKDLCMLPNRLAIALQEDGWWVRSEIVWGKPNPMPDSSGKYRPSTAHEKVFLLTKTGKGYYHAEAVAQPVSARANGGRKTNGNMKAVARGRSTYGRQTLGDAVPGEQRRKLAEPGSGIRNNSSMDSALAIMPDTRYLRNFEPAPLSAWVIATQPFKDAHFATFPPELAERCITAGCPPGGRVIDPFGGAGTTALVADQMQLDCTIIELNPESVRIAGRRIEADRGALENARDPILFDWAPAS